MKKLSIISLLVAAGCGLSSAAQAAVTCSLSPTTPAINTTVALQGGNITVGNEIPNGTVIFRQYFKVGNRPKVECESTVTPWNLRDSLIYTTNPKPLTSWNTGGWAGKLYETGVPGIGVAAWYSGTPVPMMKPISQQNVTKFNYNALPEFDISFVKIGPVSPGTILGQNLATVAANVIADGGVSVRVSTVAFSGSINVVSQTCTTPSPTYPLGKKDVSLFTGVGTTTPWVDATIKLTGCPRFYGTMDSGHTNYASESPTDRGQAGTPNANKLGLVLRPNTAIIDSTKGLIGLKAEPNVATGVGIQLMTVDDNGVKYPTFNSENTYTMSNNTSGVYSIPLLARYYQTDAKVTPGPANAAVTYTINYY